MYHIDPNINLAVERQAERVRAVQAVGQKQPSDPAAPVMSNADLPHRPQRGRVWRRWPAVAITLSALLLALVAWVGAADEVVVAWVW